MIPRGASRGSASAARASSDLNPIRVWSDPVVEVMLVLTPLLLIGIAIAVKLGMMWNQAGFLGRATGCLGGAIALLGLGVNRATSLATQRRAQLESTEQRERAEAEDWERLVEWRGPVREASSLERLGSRSSIEAARVAEKLGLEQPPYVARGARDAAVL